LKHLDSLGLIALPAGEELIELDARLLLVGGETGAFETLGAGLCGDERGEVDELARLQCHQLVARLVCLEDADGRLARRYKSVSLGP
jgi:hypothetical protein